jgi:protein-serine/threonine kinase
MIEHLTRGLGLNQISRTETVTWTYIIAIRDCFDLPKRLCPVRSPTMAYSSYRPLPSPPAMNNSYFHYAGPRSPGGQAGSPRDPYGARYGNPYSSSPVSDPDPYNNYQQQSTLPAGTLLHKGFYDLLSLIPTPSPSRLLQGWTSQSQVMAGPRYEQIQGASPSASPIPGIPTSPTRASPIPAIPMSPPVRSRRISKDMVSRPRNFVCVDHTLSRLCAELPTAISCMRLMRISMKRYSCGGVPIAKAKFRVSSVPSPTAPCLTSPDPRWANPIKNMVRQRNQERAVNEVVNALHPSAQNTPTASHPPVLRVVNGMPTPTSSTLTAATENAPRTITSPLMTPIGGPGNSTIRWAGGLPAHDESHEYEDAQDSDDTLLLHHDAVEEERPHRTITPSLATLEKAVAARIFFENLYFPLLRHPSSREQRRNAMEKDMANMQLSENHKEALRARWRQNETDYLREKRRKLDPSSFKVLKTIGHGKHLLSREWRGWIFA